MPIIDIILISIVSVFALFGLWFGLVHTLGSLLGTILGVYLAGRYYEPVAEWLISATGWGDNVARVTVFIIAFLIINRLVGMVFYFIQKFTSIFTSLPFISGLNRLLGLVFGCFEGVITIGIIIYFIDRFPLSDKIMGMLEISQIAPFAIMIASVLVPLLPEAIKLLESTVETTEAAVRNL